MPTPLGFLGALQQAKTEEPFRNWGCECLGGFSIQKGQLGGIQTVPHRAEQMPCVPQRGALASFLTPDHPLICLLTGSACGRGACLRPPAPAGPPRNWVTLQGHV